MSGRFPLLTQSTAVGGGGGGEREKKELNGKTGETCVKT